MLIENELHKDEIEEQYYFEAENNYLYEEHEQVEKDDYLKDMYWIEKHC